MTDADLDLRLAELLRDDVAPPSDGFADRVIALAAYDLSRRQWQRRTAVRVGIETLALVAVLAAFALLARLAPDSAGLGDSIPLASPAMAGLVMLAMWAMTSLSPQRR